MQETVIQIPGMLHIEICKNDFGTSFTKSIMQLHIGAISAILVYYQKMVQGNIVAFNL